MDKRVLRERMRKKQQQIRRRQMMKKGAYVVAVILVFIFVIRGIILPVINRVGGKNTDKPAQVQAETDTNANTNTGDSGTETQIEKDTNAAIRKPLKGASDLTKASQLTAGWHEDENGKWYQNADGTYYAGGLQEIDGSTYYFGDNGYAQTGWVSVGFDDYYFNDDGTYDPSQHKTRIAFTFDDGPGEYTDELLDCLEQNNAHATFFMLGQNVGSWEFSEWQTLDVRSDLIPGIIRICMILIWMQLPKSFQIQMQLWRRHVDRRQVSPEHHMETGVMISFLQSISHSLHGHWTLWTGAILMSTRTMMLL